MNDFQPTHKEAAWDWAEVLKDWRSSRARRLLRSSGAPTRPSAS